MDQQRSREPRLQVFMVLGESQNKTPPIVPYRGLEAISDSGQTVGLQPRPIQCLSVTE